jgi:hypothetical protein
METAQVLEIAQALGVWKLLINVGVMETAQNAGVMETAHKCWGYGDCPSTGVYGVVVCFAC